MSWPTEPTTCSHLTPTVGRVEGIRSFNGAALRQARINRSLSHDALGRLTGQARPNLIAWEQGRHRPTPRLLVVLADALDIDPLELLDVTEDTATLADLRGRAGQATVDVAVRLGIHPTTYRRLERGQAPLTDETAATLAGLFNTTAERIAAAYARARGAR